MSDPRRALVRMLLVAALAWHALAVLGDWRQATREQHGRDFASYYYAVDVALDGGDPYDKAALGAAAREDGTRRGVHPFFYPPPYLLTMLWVRPLSLTTAYRAWFWIDELCALAAVVALWRWWRPLGPAVGAALAASLALLTALPNNHVMGQMNLPVLLLVVLGLWAAERDRPVVGGGLLGLACMMKMSPAFFVAWWLLRGRWRAAVASGVAALALTALSLPLAGPAVQATFYGEVLPAFGSGRYNGLSVGIDIFGNHSLPNLYDQVWPEGPAHLVLSPIARALSTATLLLVVAVTGWLLRPAPTDRLARAGQIGTVGVAMLLVPVFTYEHHLVWALPAVVATAAAVHAGRLGAGWAVALGFAWTAWAYDLAALKELSTWLGNVGLPALGWALQEVKTAALLVLWAACVRLGRG